MRSSLWAREIFSGGRSQEERRRTSKRVEVKVKGIKTM